MSKPTGHPTVLADVQAHGSSNCGVGCLSPRVIQLWRWMSKRVTVSCPANQLMYIVACSGHYDARQRRAALRPDICGSVCMLACGSLYILLRGASAEASQAKLEHANRRGSLRGCPCDPRGDPRTVRTRTEQSSRHRPDCQRASRCARVVCSRLRPTRYQGHPPADPMPLASPQPRPPVLYHASDCSGPLPLHSVALSLGRLQRWGLRR